MLTLATKAALLSAVSVLVIACGNPAKDDHVMTWQNGDSVMVNGVHGRFLRSEVYLSSDKVEYVDSLGVRQYYHVMPGYVWKCYNYGRND